MKQAVLIPVRQDVHKVVMTCNMHVGDKKSIQHFTCKNAKRREHLGELHTDRKIILKESKRIRVTMYELDPNGSGPVMVLSK
jgi:hypothetical protein